MTPGPVRCDALLCLRPAIEVRFGGQPLAHLCLVHSEQFMYGIAVHLIERGEVDDARQGYARWCAQYGFTPRPLEVP